MNGHPTIQIVIDSREQTPLDFTGLDCTTEVGCVKVLDYQLKGDVNEDGTPRWAVERKSLPDFVGSITGRKEIQDREFAKIRMARRVFDKGWPIIYVVETDFYSLLPERRCPCVHPRASMRCRDCGGKATAYCACVQPRPMRKCEFCGGCGVIGYNYDRRKIGAPFLFHQISVMEIQYGVHIDYAHNALGAACKVELQLRRRWELLQIGVKK